MARGVNKAILIGNLGRDPEVRYTQSGTAVANFSLATTERTKKDGEWVDHTEWHNIVTFGKIAENCSQVSHQGGERLRRGPHPDPQVDGQGRQASARPPRSSPRTSSSSAARGAGGGGGRPAASGSRRARR